MPETHVAHTKPLSRMQSLSESCRESKVTKPIFSNSGKCYFGTKFYGVAIQMKARGITCCHRLEFCPLASLVFDLP